MTAAYVSVCPVLHGSRLAAWSASYVRLDCIPVLDLDQVQRFPWISIHVRSILTAHEPWLRGGPAVSSAEEIRRRLGAGLHVVLHSSMFKAGVKLFTIQIPQVFSIVGRIITAYSYRIKQLIHNQTSDRFGAGWIRSECRFCFRDECFAFLLRDL